MRCVSPLLVRTSGRRDFVPCGKCNFCLEVKRADWSFRLGQEQKRSNTALFLTMTYDESSVPVSEDGLLTLCKRDVQLFTKRLRKENAFHVDWPLRYYTVGEYGTRTSRPHYHSIMFNLATELHARITDIWQHGNIYVGDVKPASIHYVTKYVINRPGVYTGREPPCAMMSKRPGIGADYLRTHSQWHKDDKRNYVQTNGKIGRLPRYYKDKIFNAYERNQMAQKAIAQGDEAYSATVDRLSRFHDDPYYYYDERISHALDAVVLKVNKTNKF